MIMCVYVFMRDLVHLSVPATMILTCVWLFYCCCCCYYFFGIYFHNNKHVYTSVLYLIVHRNVLQIIISYKLLLVFIDMHMGWWSKSTSILCSSFEFQFNLIARWMKRNIFNVDRIGSIIYRVFFVFVWFTIIVCFYDDIGLRF